MLEILKRFFRFCDARERREFYSSIVLGVLAALFSALKLPAIGELTREKTVIMIVHRLKTVRNADQILVVDQGRIVQRGTHDELIQQDGIYRSFVAERGQAAGWKV